MTIYDEMRDIVSEIMPDFDQSTIYLVRMISGTGPVDNPGAPTPERIKLQAVASGVSFKYVKDGFAVSTDLTVTAAPLSGVVVSINDFIEIDGTRYKIVQDISAPGAGTRVVWKLIVRKG